MVENEFVRLLTGRHVLLANCSRVYGLIIEEVAIDLVSHEGKKLRLLKS